jgi:hypothetical protein
VGAFVAGAAGLALYHKLSNGNGTAAASTVSPGSAKVVYPGNKKRVVMVTGGTGLVGKGIEEFISECPEAKANESWIFLSSKDGDLCDAVIE